MSGDVVVGMVGMNERLLISGPRIGSLRMWRTGGAETSGLIVLSFLHMAYWWECFNGELIDGLCFYRDMSRPAKNGY